MYTIQWSYFLVDPQWTHKIDRLTPFCKWATKPGRRVDFFIVVVHLRCSARSSSLDDKKWHDLASIQK